MAANDSTTSASLDSLQIVPKIIDEKTVQGITQYFPEFMHEEYLGNSLDRWIIASAGILLSIVAAKLIYWIISNVVKKFTAKTKTNLDDLLIEKLEGPVAFAIGLFGIWISTEILHFAPGFETFLRAIFYIATLGNIAWSSTRLIDALIDEYIVPLTEKSSSDLDDQVLPIVRKALKITVWIIAIIIGLSNAGYDVGALITGLGIGGLAFALAAQDSMKNLFGGITIFTDKPFKIKDRIIVAGTDGVVEEIGIRSTRIRTLMGRRVTIPNSIFSNTGIENVTSEPLYKVVINLGLTYDMGYEKMNQAIATLTEIAEKNDGVQKNYFINFNKFLESSLNIEFSYFIIKDKEPHIVQTEMNMEILRQFEEKGLNFAYPTRTVYQKTV
jgi:MscS family membrane protein